MNDRMSPEIAEAGPAVSLPVFLASLGAIAAGTLLAAVALPAWLPGLASSLLGPEPKAYWFLSRGSAMAAYGLLWLSMIFGLLITSRAARLWPGGPAAFDLHQYFSLLGLAFALFHGLVLMGDQYIHFGLLEVALPFGGQNYRPGWVGLGQLSFYTWGAVAASFYVRKRLGNKAWRLIHFASFGTYLMALVHGVGSGTDTNTLWAANLYTLTGAGLLFLLFYRILAAAIPARSRAKA